MSLCVCVRVCRAKNNRKQNNERNNNNNKTCSSCSATPEMAAAKYKCKFKLFSQLSFRSFCSLSLSPSHTHLRRRIVCNAARGCDVRVRACVHVCVLCSVAMLKMDIVVKCFFDFVSTVDTTKTK